MPFVHEFRWGLNNSNTVWYNNVQIFRQNKINNWKNVISEVKTYLESLVKKKLSIDLREIENENISYTVNTLKSLRADFLDDALFLIVGEDVFNLIDNWKDWESLLNYTHIIVATRRPEKKDSMSDKLKKWRDDNKTDDIKILKSTLFGYIFYIDIPIVEISSTMIRQCYSTNETMDEYLPSNIITYIKENNLYIDN